MVRATFLSMYYSICSNIQRSLIEVDSKFGKKSEYGITHSINSLVRTCVSMEPKSIAFYTAVAVGILAVLGATIIPTIGQVVQAQTTTEQDNADDQGAEDNADDSQSTQDEASGTTDGPTLAASDGVVSCGEEITSDVTLQQDLECPGDGVVINTDDVVFNLNGHSITSSDGGDNSVDLTMDVDGNSGISVTAAGVTILGLGQISGYDNGIKFTGASDAQVTDVTLRDNGIGALVSGSETVYISKNSIDTNDYGIVSKDSDSGVSSFNQVVSNGAAGLVYLNSNDNVLAGNGVFGNGETGIFLDGQSSGNTVDYNIVFGHSEADMNNANGMATNINDNTFGENNKCGTSTPAGLC